MATWKLVHEGALPQGEQMIRSPGPHVSDAIRKMAIARGDFEDRGVGEFSKPHIHNKIQIGNAFEDWLIGRLQADEPGRYVRGRETTKDGIHGTDDLIDLADECEDEIKATWMSAKRGIDDPKLRKWIEQVQSYCHMRGFRKARLRTIHMNGYYSFMSPRATQRQKDNDGPLYRVWEGEFTESELVEHWQRVKYELEVR